MFLDALVTARADFEAELERHEKSLESAEEEVKRDEHAARRDVALAVSAAVGGFASAAAPPLPPGPRDDDAPITLPDAKPAVVLARAALQLAEARLDEPPPVSLGLDICGAWRGARSRPTASIG